MGRLVCISILIWSSHLNLSVSLDIFSFTFISITCFSILSSSILLTCSYHFILLSSMSSFNLSSFKRPLGRLRHSWEVNIKVNLREVVCNPGDWIDLAQNKDDGRT